MHYGLNEAELGAKFTMRGARRTSRPVRTSRSFGTSSGRVARPMTTQDWLKVQGANTSDPRFAGGVRRGIKTWRPGLGYYEPELGKFKLKKITKSVAKVAKKAAKVAVKPAALVTASGLKAVGLKSIADKAGKAVGLTEAERKLTSIGGKVIQAAAITAGAVAAAPYVATAAGAVGKGALVAGKFAATKLAAAKTLLPKGIALAKNLLGKKVSGGGEEEAPAETAPSYETPSYAEPSSGVVSPETTPQRFDSAYASMLVPKSAGGGGSYLPEQEAGAEGAAPSTGSLPGWVIPAAGAALMFLK